MFPTIPILLAVLPILRFHTIPLPLACDLPLSCGEMAGDNSLELESLIRCFSLKAGRQPLATLKVPSAAQTPSEEPISDHLQCQGYVLKP